MTATAARRNRTRLTDGCGRTGEASASPVRYVSRSAARIRYAPCVLPVAPHVRTETAASSGSRAALLPWVLPAAFGLALLVANVAYVHRFTVDDAYITLRYSRNVARGIGAVYNATGARAEGYTSFLWML